MEKLCSRGEADYQKDQCPFSQQRRIDDNFFFEDTSRVPPRSCVGPPTLSPRPSEGRMPLKVTLLGSSYRSRCMLKLPVMNTEEFMTNLLKSSDNSEKNCFRTGPVL